MRKTKPQRRMPFVYGLFTVASVLVALSAYFAVFLIDIETALATGPAIGILGIILMSFAKKYSHPPGTRMGYFMIAFVLGLTLLTWVANWGPSEAYTPFGILGAGFVITMFVLSNRSFASAPRRYQDWQCQGCGYPVYGLTSYQCPECGSDLNPSFVDHYRDKTPDK